MSMPINLSNCIYDHMPNGNFNEWKAFDDANVYSLEAYGNFPVFWLLLFQKNNIKHAKYIENVDLEDEYAEHDRQEFWEIHGDSHFPYFIVSQAMGLNNLKKRKQQFLHVFGQEYLEPYEYFEKMIREDFPNFILLDTVGLDITENTEQEFSKVLTEYELLAQPQIEPNDQFWMQLKKDISKFENLADFLFGYSYSEINDVKQVYFKNQHHIAPKITGNDLPDFIYWIFGIIIAIPTIYVWYKTNSWLYGFITFAIFAAIFSFIAIKLTSKNTK